MREPNNYLPEVRNQYEALPYPACDPLDEHRRLARTWLEDLPMVNHYCFAGRQSFRNGFRALVAGDGTGDATIFLAEQLRHSNTTWPTRTRASRRCATCLRPMGPSV